MPTSHHKNLIKIAFGAEYSWPPSWGRWHDEVVTEGVLVWWDFTPSVSFADSSPIGGAHYHFRRQRLAAARSRHGSDSPPDCHSLPCRHFATLHGRWVEFLLPLGRCGHRPLQFVRFLHITVGCDAHIAPRKSDKIAFGVGTLLPSLQSSVTAKYKYQLTTVFFSVPAFKLRLSSQSKSSFHDIFLKF